jgi:nicotinic acid mononucleotide adenylyltransferase
MVDASREVPSTPAVILVDAPTAPVSSTDVRRRARDGNGIDHLVAPGVAAYIEKYGLYRDTVKDDA